jgi:hypothetical protein
MAVNTEIIIFWGMAPCGLAFSILEELLSLSAFWIEILYLNRGAVDSTKMLEFIYRTTHHHIPEGVNHPCII